MSVTSFEIHNFKAIKSAHIPLDKLWLIYGNNSAWKSSIIQSLLLFKQSIDSKNNAPLLLTLGDYVDLGDITNVMHRSDKKNISSELITYTFELSSNAINLDAAIRELEREYAFRLKTIKTRASRITNLDLTRTISAFPAFLQLVQWFSISKHPSCMDAFKELESHLISEIHNFINQISPSSTNNLQLDSDPINELVRFHFFIKDSKEDLESIHASYSELYKINVELSNTPIFLSYDFHSWFCVEYRAEYFPSTDEGKTLFRYCRTDRRSNPTFDSEVFSFSNSTNRNFSKDLKEWTRFIWPIHYFDATSIVRRGAGRAVLWHALNFASDASREVFNFFENISYCAPIRHLPERYAFSRKLDFWTDPSGKNLIFEVSNNLDQFHFLQEYWKKLWIFDTLHVKNKKNSLIREYDVSNHGINGLSLLDVGCWVSQVMPIISILGKAKEGSLVLFEQPEIHLHPSLQAKLMDIFIGVSKEKNIAMLIETHSDYFLRRSQRRLIEASFPSNKGSSLKRSDLSFIAVSFDTEKSVAKVDNINVDEETFQLTYPVWFLPEEDDRFVYLDLLQKKFVDKSIKWKE